MKRKGCQIRETLEEVGMRLVELRGTSPNREAVLQDDSVGYTELWSEKDDFAGYVIEIEGVGYEFVRTIWSTP